MTHAELARQNFTEGCNCAQAVLLAFSDLTGMDEQTAKRLASSFGGGMGRLREVCGAVSAMFMVAGLLYGSDEPTDKEAKAADYARIQALAASFREKNGSILCRELLDKADTAPKPDARTAEYYQKRPCAMLCADAAEIMSQYIEAHPLP